MKKTIYYRRTILLVAVIVLLILLVKFRVPGAIHSRDLDEKYQVSNNEVISTIIMITPTYKRLSRMADLTSLGHTLMRVPSLYWILVEDHANETDPLIENLLSRLNLNFTYLLAPSSAGITKKGINQRNKGLDYLREKFAGKLNLAMNYVVYFGDDDNTYDLRLFEILRPISKIGVWPVALCGGLVLEKLKVENKTENFNSSRLIGFDVRYQQAQPFRVDMAGFAVNLRILLERPWARFFNGPTLESVFLQLLTAAKPSPELMVQLNSTRSPKIANLTQLSYDEIIPLEMPLSRVNGKRDVLVWHRKTMPVNLELEQAYKNQNLRASDYGWNV